VLYIFVVSGGMNNNSRDRDGVGALRLHNHKTREA
jgi:hypothetical protein